MISPQAAAQLQNLELIARQIVEGFLAGLHRSPYQGLSVEFSEYLPYQPGHSLDQIDWRVFARTDRLYIRRYEAETNLQAYLLLDTSGSMRYPTQTRPHKLDYALFLAAALAHLLITQRDAVGLYLLADQIQTYLPARARHSWLRRIFLALEPLRGAPPASLSTQLPHLLHNVVERLRRRSLILLFSDLLLDEGGLEPFFKGLAHLRHQGHEVIVFRIWHEKTESAFALPTEPLQLISLESGKALKVHPIDLIALYQAHMSQYESQLKRFCQRLQIDYVTVDLEEPFFKPLYTYLLKRARLP